jgi:hypothetical protein
VRRLIDGDDVNARDEQSPGAAQEEDVTICQGTGKEGAQEGVGEWKPGIAERAGAGLLVAPLCRGRAHGVRRPTRTLLSFYSTSLRVRLVIFFAIEGLDARIQSLKPRVLWRSSFI